MRMRSVRPESRGQVRGSLSRAARAALAGPLIVVCCAVGAAGCSLLFDTEDYRGVEQGPVPTAPQVSITVAEPTTLDDLEVIIDVASTDPLAGTVDYRYEWDREEGGATVTTSVTTDVVPASETAKHQTWTVRVIPFVGEREGPAGTASVTVVNSLPVVHFARLSRYEVWQDETITASAFVTDPDGDATTLSYSWMVNDAPVADATSAIDLSVLQPGDTLRVSVTATDNDRAESLVGREAGPATVRAAVGWRQLEPNRGYATSTPLFFPDAPRGRMLYIREGALWEYRVTGATEVPWAKLNVTGLPDLFGSSVIYDAARSRFLIWGGVDFTTAPSVPSTALYELVVETPGQETFREVTTALTPPARIAHATLNDEPNARAVILGGARPETLPVTFTLLYDDLWELDYSTSDPTFRMVTANAATPPAVLMGATVNSQSGRGYLFGGFSQAGSPLGGIYQYDFDGGSLVEVATLAVPRGGLSVSDLGDGRALIVDGATTLIGGERMETSELFAFSDHTFAPLTVTWERPEQTVGAVLKRAGDTLYWYPGLFSGDLFLSTVTDFEVTSRLAPHTEVPGVTYGGAVVRGPGASPGVTFAFGVVRRDFDRAISGSTFNFTGDRWTLLTALSDPTLARSGPSPVMESSRLPSRVFGSSLMASFQPNSSVVSNSSGAWLEQRADEATLHNGLSEFAVPAWRCNDRTRVLVDGYTYELDPAGAASALPDLGGRVPQLRGPGYEALQPVQGTQSDPAVETVVVFGGDGTDTWWTSAMCNPNDDWTARVVSPGPSARYAPSMAKRVPNTTMPTSQLFLFGGATALNGSRTHMADFWLVTMDAAEVLTAQQLPSGGGTTPPARSMAVMGWDSFRGRLILFGGEGDGGHEFPTNSGGVGRADTWEYRMPAGL